ncbi:MAG: cytochrome c oxidase subunit 3 [Myxococcota bacterium]
MSATATAEHGHAAHVLPPDEHFGTATTGKIGMWIFLLSDAFSFGGLLLAYGILRGGSAVWRGPTEPALGINFTAGLTFLLICSSVTMVLAVAAAAEHDRKATVRWLALTALGGALFLAGQMEEYWGVFGVASHGLTHEGLVFGKSAYASTFYVTTSFHGLHVLTGTLYILITMVRTMAGKTDHNEVEVLGLFWHFVDLIWILVFTFIYLL